MHSFAAPVLRAVPQSFGVAPMAWSRASPAGRWRRALTYALALLWLLDATLQYQPYMFSAAFPTQVITPAAAGSPGWVAGPARWTATLIAGHVVLFNGLFATVQLAIAAGLFLTATVRVALAASIVWSLMVWWLGEGLGGILAGPVSPLAGMPGAVALYALIAMLLWPPRPRPTFERNRRSVASAGLLGTFGAQLGWLVLWASFAFEAVRPANRQPSALADSIRGMAGGEPKWLAAVNHVVAGAIARHGAQYSIGLAVVCVLIGISVLVPSLTRFGLVAATALALGIWVVGQDLGEIATGMSTDPNSGLPLALLALCYWPLRRTPPTPDTGEDVAPDAAMRSVIRTAAATPRR
jgi:hypothetical protein